LMAFCHNKVSFCGLAAIYFEPRGRPFPATLYRSHSTAGGAPAEGSFC
jgi:hypothetical protein